MVHPCYIAKRCPYVTLCVETYLSVKEVLIFARFFCLFMSKMCIFLKKLISKMCIFTRKLTSKMCILKMVILDVVYVGDAVAGEGIL